MTNRTRVTHGAPASHPPPNVSYPAGTARAPFRTGEPTPSVIPARRAWKPAPTACGVRRLTGNVISPAPTLHQPLSHGALRRDSSPFRGAEGWEDAWGVYALVCRDADTVVFLAPVRGGVLDAPRLRDCRGVGADGRRGRLRRRLMRRVRFCLLPNVCDFAGTARAPFLAGEPTSSVIPGREGVKALPYGVKLVRHPAAGRRGRRPLRAVCILHVAAYNVRVPPAHHFKRASNVFRSPTPGGRGSPPLRVVRDI